MLNNLTTRQSDILNYIVQYTKTNGYPPTVREIGEAVGLNSSSTVHGHLNKLEEKGLIKRNPTKPRAIELLDDCKNALNFNIAYDSHSKRVSIPLVGTVTAGMPILANENIEEVYDFPFSLVQNENVFMLKISGDSMIEAGILDKDYVIVRKQDIVSNGEIVVALIEDEPTVKRFYKEKNRIKLQPENKYMEPLYYDNVSILGKVIGVFRNII